MRNDNLKNQNTQIPSMQGGAEQPQINVDDVNYAIKKLSAYDDAYSQAILTIFTSYLIHKDYSMMRSEIELMPRSGPPIYNIWDINASSGFLEVIYPSAGEGVDNGK